MKRFIHHPISPVTMSLLNATPAGQSSRVNVRARGLPHVHSEEVIRFPGNRRGIACNLEPDEIAIVLLDESASLYAGQEISRTQRIVDVPVGEALLGRVVDALGRPIDEGGPLRSSTRRPVERPATAIMDRDPVSVPLVCYFFTQNPLKARKCLYVAHSFLE